MPMPREDHEALLNELLDGELDVSRRTEILQQLRTDYSTVITDHESQTESIAKLTKDKDDLIVSNSQLFRQLGIVGGSEADKEKHEEQSFSQTVTLEALEK